MKKLVSFCAAVTATAIFLVGCKKPTASFTADKSEVEIGEVVTFTNTSADAGAYIWDFGDGGSSSKMNATHVYERAGDYTVSLTSAKRNGKKPAEAQTLTIKVKGPKDPTSVFTASKTSAMPGESISFTNTSANAEEFVWDFGDGGLSLNPNPTHVYQNGGTYTVTLTSYSQGRKLSASSTSTITVGYSSGNFQVEANLVGNWKLSSHSLTHTVGGVSTSTVPSNYISCFYGNNQSLSGNYPFSSTFTAATTPMITLSNGGSITVYDGDGNIRGNGNYNVFDSNKMTMSHSALYTSASNNSSISNSGMPSFNLNGVSQVWTITSLTSTTLTLTFTYKNNNITYTWYNCGGTTPNPSSYTGTELITETVTYTKQ